MLQFKNDVTMLISIRHVGNQMAKFTRLQNDKYDHFKDKIQTVKNSYQLEEFRELSKRLQNLGAGEAGNLSVSDLKVTVHSIDGDVKDIVKHNADTLTRSETTKGYEDLSEADKEEFESFKQLLGQINGLNLDDMIDVSTIKRAERLEELKDVNSLTKWADVFRKEEYREKPLFESFVKRFTGTAVQIKEMPLIEKEKKRKYQQATYNMFMEALTDDMLQTIHKALEPNEDAVQLAQKKEAVAHRTYERLSKKINQIYLETA